LRRCRSAPRARLGRATGQSDGCRPSSRGDDGLLGARSWTMARATTDGLKVSHLLPFIDPPFNRDDDARTRREWGDVSRMTRNGSVTGESGGSCLRRRARRMCRETSRGEEHRAAMRVRLNAAAVARCILIHRRLRSQHDVSMHA
jgi:hypothetical protein